MSLSTDEIDFIEAQSRIFKPMEDAPARKDGGGVVSLNSSSAKIRRYEFQELKRANLLEVA